ncbi:hypothetical protein GQ457_10G012510 [Hibiscus cannabinus]
MLRRYRSDPTHIMPVEEIELYSDLSYEEEPVEILTSDSKGKPIWEVRTRNWKLREGENRLSGLLEGVSMIHGCGWYNEGMRDDAMRLACMRNGAMRLACMRNDATRLAWMRNDATRLAWMRNDATMLAWMRNDATMLT